MSNVLVMFQADTEHTEQMALAVAVGAVEAEASIRLRRLAVHGAVEVAHKGYGKLQLEGKKAWTFGSEGLTANRSKAQILVESALKAAGVVLVPIEESSGQGLIERMKQAGRISGK
jgi:hypothetical protein